MGLNIKERSSAAYFTGVEVEHTITHGMLTLFVVGCPTLEEILQKAKHKVNDVEIKQIYFGTSQSFNPKSNEDWHAWDVIITGCLKAGFWVTLDFDVEYVNQIHEETWNEYDHFIPMISVKLPHIKLFNYNTTLKLDDTHWKATNSGVWTHHLNKLIQYENYTHWDQYAGDSTV